LSWSCCCRSGFGRQSAALSIRWLRLCWDNRAPRGVHSRDTRQGVEDISTVPFTPGLRRTSLAPIAGPPALFNSAHQSASPLIIARLRRRYLRRTRRERLCLRPVESKNQGRPTGCNKARGQQRLMQTGGLRREETDRIENTDVEIRDSRSSLRPGHGFLSGPGGAGEQRRHRAGAL
jgi:hypothetical protein